MNTTNMPTDPNRRRRRRRGRAGAAALAALAVLCVPALAAPGPEREPAPAATGSLEAPQRWATESGLAGRLDGARGQQRILITLRGDPLAPAARAPRRRQALAGALTTLQVRELRHGGQRAGQRLSQTHERERERALDGLEPAARQGALRRRALIGAVRRLGGRVLEEHPIGHALTATVPAAALEQLAARPDVAAIDEAPHLEPLSVGTSSQAVGAPSFWAAGYTGGGGANDMNPSDLAIFGDKIQQDHPAFTGISFQRPPNAPVNTNCGASPCSLDHGTAVASLAISQGASGCPTCQPSDANEQGVAIDTDTVLDADLGSTNCGSGIDNGAWALGLTIEYGSCPGQPVAGATDPAEVASSSYGDFESGVEDSLSLRITDSYYSTTGLSWSLGAGNEGPGQAVAVPSIAYNTVSVGAFDPQGTVGSSDDTIPGFSSRGPTPAGRKKPDMVAVGVPGNYANRRWYVAGQNLFTSGLNEGTSFAAPQVAGGLTLLAGSGVTDPLAQKAVLINSARQGRSTPGAAMGTQIGWQPDWGWGALDLTATLAERTNFQSGTVAGGSARFYRTTLQAAGERATLVWARRTTGCVGPGCRPQGLTLSNLDLAQVNGASGATEASSASAIDNVEQTRSPAGNFPRQVVYKVKAASSVDGLAGEPFAVTARRPLQALVTPQPTLAVTRSVDRARQGDQVTVTAVVANPSPDLSAEAAQATISLPAGVELVSGAVTQPLGTLAAQGQAGDQATATWVVRGTTDGLKALTVTGQASRYGETFQAPAQGVQVLVDSTPPGVTLAAPAGTTRSTSAALSWGGSDGGVGLAGFDLEQSIDAGPYTTVLANITATNATVATPAGHRYRFRLRARDTLGNTSGYVESGELTVTLAAQPPPPPGKVAAGLRITKTMVAKGRLTILGRVSTRATGRVYAGYRARLAGRLRLVKGSARPVRGRFRIVVRLGKLAKTKKGKLTLTYRGNTKVRRGRLARTLRRR